MEGFKADNGKHAGGVGRLGLGRLRLEAIRVGLDFDKAHWFG